MNPQNYASLEASKRLQDAGIVLETEVYWRIPFDVTVPPHLVLKKDHLECFGICADFIPAPSMAEVWRELPGGTVLYQDKITRAAYGNWTIDNANPTDALIDLMIWVTQQKEAKDVVILGR